MTGNSHDRRKRRRALARDFENVRSFAIAMAAVSVSAHKCGMAMAEVVANMQNIRMQKGK